MVGERNKICFKVYTDADWAGENTDRKSVDAALTYVGVVAMQQTVIGFTFNNRERIFFGVTRNRRNHGMLPYG